MCALLGSKGVTRFRCKIGFLLLKPENMIGMRLKSDYMTALDKF